MADLAFSCTCGGVTGTLRDVGPALRQGTRATCFCNSCRSAQLYLGQPDPRPGPVALYQTTPDRIEIATGAAHLAAFRFRAKGAVRWYAACCQAPLWVSGPGPKLPFVSVDVNRISGAAALGPVRATAFVDRGNGKQGHKGLAAFITGFLRRTVTARLSGSWKTTPLFDAAGAPVAALRVLTKEDKAALPLQP